MDNDANAIKEQYKGLGTFHIELWRSVDEGVSRMPNEGFAQSSAKDLGAVPENALKGSELDVTTWLSAFTMYPRQRMQMLTFIAMFQTLGLRTICGFGILRNLTMLRLQFSVLSTGPVVRKR